MFVVVVVEVTLRTFPNESASGVRAAIRQKLNNAEKTLQRQKQPSTALVMPESVEG